MKQKLKTLSILLLLGLGGCRYNYIIVNQAKEVKKPEVKPNPIPDRWNYPDPRELGIALDSIANNLKHAQ